jgi:hypothetical protein
LRRALVAGLIVTAACGNGDGPGPVSVKDVSVTATSTSLLVGATTQLSAVVTGLDGQPVHGARVTWSTSAPGILAVSASGLVTALAPGEGTVRAFSGGRSGEVTLTVTNPPVASVAVDRDSAVLTLPAGSVTLNAVAKDAGGHVITGVAFFFASDAPKVASVSPVGVVTAVAAGTAFVSATTEGKTATVRVRVTAAASPTSPHVTSVSPLQAGGAAVVNGSNFAPTIGGNTVLIEGVAATVTGATATQLNITLPTGAWACDAERPVALQVNANGETGVGAASLRTAIRRTLAVGEAAVLSNAADARCNELPATGGRYVLTVYNTARATQGGEASFTLRGVATGAAARATTTAVSADAPSLSSTARAGATPFSRWDRARRETSRSSEHADILQRSIDFARASGSPAPALRRLRALSAEGLAPARPTYASQIATVGAITPLKVPNLDAPNFCSANIAIGARTAWVGQRAIIVEDTVSVLNGTPTLKGQLDSLYAQVGQEFDTVMWPILTQSFGNPLAMDQLLSRTGKVVMLFSPRVNAMLGGAITGFVASCDFFPVSQAPSSNVGEYFYAIAPTSLASGYGVGTRDAWRREMRGTIIHEVKHITSFGERFSRNAEFEELWLEEGTARHAEELFARGVYGTAWKANTGYQASTYCDLRPSGATAPQCAGTPLLMLRHFDALYQYLESPESHTVLGRTGPGDATFYGTAWSVVRWMIDHFATSESAFLTGLVQSTRSGVANLEARVAGRTWEEMLGEWALMLYADDYPGVAFANPRLQFPSWNLRDQFLGLCGDKGPCINPSNPSNVYPVAFPYAPRATSFGAFSTSVNSLGAGTFTSWLLSGTQSAPQLLDLRGAFGGEAPGQLRIAILRVE